MGKIVRNGSLVIAIAVGLTGCADKNSPSEGNFRTALADIRPDNSCLRINRANDPNIEKSNFHGGVFEGYPIFQVFVRAGYFERVEGGTGNNVIYAVAPKAEPIARRIQARLGNGYRVGLCPGKVVIESLTYSIPGESASQVSKVNVKWKVDGVTDEFLALNEEAGADTFSVSKAELSGDSDYVLQLTNEGWKMMDSPF